MKPSMKSSMKPSRRQFCQTIGITGAAVLTGASSNAYCRQLPTVPFGKTGLHVSRLGLSASMLHLAPHESEADFTIRYMLDCGVNYFDTSPNYGAGYGEKTLGKTLKPIREQTVIAAKTREWSRRAALRDLDDSLIRLQTGYVDVWMLDNPLLSQLHFICSEDGTLAAAIEAKKKGKCRFIGISGQSHPQWLMAYCEQIEFDVVQMPLNAVDPHYLSFEELALSKMNRNETAIVGSKTYALGTLRETPLIQQQEALRYAISLPVSVTLVSCRTKQQAIEDIHTVFNSQPFTGTERTKILSQSKPLSSRDTEWYKTII